MQDRPVLIIAATGKTSVEIVKKLQKRKTKVRVLVRSVTKAKEMFGESVEIFDGFDFDNPATMAASMSGIYKLYLVSSPAINAFEQTISLVDVAKEVKGSYFATIDQFTKKIVPLFNPLRQVWNEHFYFEGARIEGKTQIGQGTARLLQFNLPNRVLQRQVLMSQEQYS